MNVLHFRLSTIQQGGGFCNFYLFEKVNLSLKVGVVYLSC